MVANQEVHSTNKTQLYYELNQQKRDASDALRQLRVVNGKPINIELWRKSLDTALSLINANHYLHYYYNKYLSDPTEISEARTEFQLKQVTTSMKSMNVNATSSSGNVKIEEKKDETNNDGGKDDDCQSHYSLGNDKSDDGIEFLRNVLRRNMDKHQTAIDCGVLDREEDVYYLDTTLARNELDLKNPTVLSHLKNTLNMDVDEWFSFEDEVDDGNGGTMTSYLKAPLEDAYKRRKRTIVYNMIRESIKEIKEYLYAHIVFGDIEGLVSWIMQTYSIDRRADREKKHYQRFNQLANSYEIKNFDNWIARVVSYLAEDKILKMNTPYAFVRLKLNDAVENHGDDELKQAWNACENELTKERFEARKTTFDENDLHDFLRNVKTRFHSYTKTKHTKPPTKKVRKTTGGKGNQNKPNKSKPQQSTNSTNGPTKGKPCIYYNMYYGCKATECKFDHEVIEDESERRRMIDMISKNQRCNICGLGGHKQDDCEKRDEMKTILQKRSKKLVRKTKKQSKEGQPNTKNQDDNDDNEPEKE